MNEVAIANDRRMTIREVADTLGLSPDTVYNSAKELFPDIFVPKKTTYLNEAQVTAVKMNFRKNSEVMKQPKTDLEKALMIKQAMQFQQEIIDTLQTENTGLKSRIDADRPKVELAERAMMSKGTFSMSEAAKEMKLGYGDVTLFQKLRAAGLMQTDPKNQPYQQHVGQGYFVVDMAVKRCGETDRVFATTRVTAKGIAWLLRTKERWDSPAAAA